MPNETIDDILENMDELLDRAKGVPFSGKKCLVDVDQLREYIDSIRYNLPGEIQNARRMIADRTEIIKGANVSAEEIIKKAEARAKVMVSQEEIVKQATATANEIVSKAKEVDIGIKKAMVEKLDSILGDAESSITNSLKEIKAMREALKQAARKAPQGGNNT